MNFQINPFNSELSFKFYLEKFKEFNELDFLMKFYIEGILKQRIYQRPSKGPYGEKGKDIVVIEDETTLEFCSYVIKCGTLHGNLDGKYGIINQMRDALNIELEEEIYKNKKRTVVVIHNGEEGYRGAIKKFEDNRMELQNHFDRRLLSRDIERWDISTLCQRLYPCKDKLLKLESFNNRLNRLFNAENAIRNFLKDAGNFSIDKSSSGIEKVISHINELKDIEKKWGKF